MIYDKCKNLINREIKEENEPKDTAVLIRVLCLLDLVFLNLITVVIYANWGASYGAAASVLLLLVIATLVLSYKVRMSALVYCYFIAISINSAALILNLGLSFMIQAQFLVGFIVFFYRAAGKEYERIASIIVSAVILFGLVFYNKSFGSIIVADDHDTMLLTCICMVYILAKVATVAYFFRRKFSASEEKIIKYSKKLEMLATTDPLTKLQNRRGMLKHIEEYSEMIIDKGGLLTLAIGDIDFFKKINDTYGHDAGDYVLETLAKIMNDFMDGKGMVARWGGEEFLFSLESINGDYAFEEMSKLLHLVEKYEFSFAGTPIQVTMTFGLEEYDDNIGIDKVISKADEKLYMGKEQGRNRVIY